MQQSGESWAIAFLAGKDKRRQEAKRYLTAL